MAIIIRRRIFFEKELMKRIALFLATNIAVMVVIGLITSIFGLNRFIGPNGVDVATLMGYSLVVGFAGATISLLMSKIVETVRRFADKAGIDMPEVGIYQGEPNAFATGAFKNSALVAVSTGLLQGMTREEIEAVIGHEIAHVANGDMVTMTLIQGVMNTFVVFLSRLIGTLIDSALRRNDDSSGAPGIGYYVSTVVLDILFGFLAGIIVAWFSRQREFRADAGSAELMGQSQSMTRALQRLGGMHAGALPENMQAMGITGQIGKLFSSHPPIEERIAALQARQQMQR